jgi:DNA-binding transcriptional MerR regulator
MDKSPQAFRTISEVSDSLDVPAHVLRFWESKFPQIKPIKRGGGRRYYRPEDVTLLLGIRELLYDDGLTIKGVQKIFRERGVRHVVRRGAEAVGQKPAAEAAEADAPSEEARVEAPAPEASGPEAERARVLAVIAKLEALRDRLRSDPAPEGHEEGRADGRAAS